MSHAVEDRSWVKSDAALIQLGPVSHRLFAGLCHRTNVRCFPLACQANHLAQITRLREASSEKHGELRHE